MSQVVKIYTAQEVVTLLKVDYKTVLNLIQRGQLKAPPGIRHKRITEAELSRYLGTPARTTAITATLPARPAGMESVTDKTLVNPTSKIVATSLAQSSQRKIK